MKIFVVESSNPIEVINGKAEHKCIETIGKLFSHQVLSFPIKSKYELEDTFNYISTVDQRHDSKKNYSEPLCLHISTHGNEKGIAIGNSIIKWNELSDLLYPIFNKRINYEGKKIMVISACGAIYQKLTNEFEKNYYNNDDFTPPKYLFVYNQNNVNWSDAIVAWTILYRYLSNSYINDEEKIISMINRLKKSDIVDLRYFVWDKNKEKYEYYYYKEERMKKCYKINTNRNQNNFV